MELKLFTTFIVVAAILASPKHKAFTWSYRSSIYRVHCCYVTIYKMEEWRLCVVLRCKSHLKLTSIFFIKNPYLAIFRLLQKKVLAFRCQAIKVSFLAVSSFSFFKIFAGFLLCSRMDSKFNPLHVR